MMKSIGTFLCFMLSALVTAAGAASAATSHSIEANFKLVSGPYPDPAYVNKTVVADVSASCDDPTRNEESQINGPSWSWATDGVWYRATENDTWTAASSGHQISINHPAANSPAATFEMKFGAVGYWKVRAIVGVTYSDPSTGDVWGGQDSKEFVIRVTDEGTLAVESTRVAVGGTKIVRCKLVDGNGDPQAGVALSIDYFDAYYLDADWQSSNVTDSNGEAVVVIYGVQPTFTTQLRIVADLLLAQDVGQNNQQVVQPIEYQPQPKLIGEFRPLILNKALDVMTASDGEKITLHTLGFDEDQRRPANQNPPAAWETFVVKDKTSIRFTVRQGGATLPGGNPFYRVPGTKNDSGNVELTMPNPINVQQPVKVLSTVTDVEANPQAPDIGTRVDNDTPQYQWTITKRFGPPPTSMARSAGDVEGQWIANVLSVTYKAGPALQGPAPHYADQTVQESFGANEPSFQMADIKDAWKQQNPNLDTPVKVADFFFGATGGSNATFVINNQDEFADRHGGSPASFADIFKPTALAGDGVNVKREQVYSAANATIGTYIVTRRVRQDGANVISEVRKEPKAN